ncbi:hypothetical protein LBMAG37_11770 [Anaerolineae bacterium]|nr:hypothetical protein EMGBD1_18250 [Anaerolineaceae bacterium]GDX68022.1 hypothetical protein LBMAG37_11770 [Anaerolineae bacterium]
MTTAIMQLLQQLPEPSRLADWPKYSALGIEPAHVSALIEIATNPAESGALQSAAVHARRALGQLGAGSAVGHLLNLFHQMETDTWVVEELPRVLALLGRAATPAITAYAGNAGHPLFARGGAVLSLELMGAQHRGACVQALIGLLANFAHNPPTLNGIIIVALANLKAAEALALIEEAFEADAVDDLTTGDLDEIAAAIRS